MKAFFLDHDHETNKTHLVMSISDICYKYDADSGELYAVIDLTDYPHLLKTFATGYEYGENLSDLDTECRKLRDEKKEIVEHYEKELREMRCDLRKLRENLNNIRVKSIVIQQICAEV